MDKTHIHKILSKHLPQNAVDQVVEIMIEHQVYLNITKSRSSKLGDFRVPAPGKKPRISVNYNLNPYAFLITLVHEISHLIVYTNSGAIKSRIKPHGREWKHEFKLLMNPFLNPDIFPYPLLNIVKRHMLNPKASSSSDIELVRELKKHDRQQNNSTMLSDYHIGDVFNFKNRNFRILKKNRTRFLCEDLENRRKYLIHSLVEVDPVK